MSIKRKFSAIAAGALLTAFSFSAPASATVINCTAEGPSGQTTTYSLTVSTNAECFTGNSLGNFGVESGDLEVLGLNGWTLQDSTDQSASGAGDVYFTSFTNVGGTSGTWSIDGQTWPFLMITLKAGNTFAAFLIENTVPQMGTWSSSRDLSHGDLFSNIPLPAAAWLMLAGLGGLGLVARRRRKDGGA